jgi:hypothetical protein
LDLGKGTERLELSADGTYVQDTIFHSQPVRHTGRWRIENHLFEGSQVVLDDAAIVPAGLPGDDSPTLQSGHLPMWVHDRSGKVQLARNEVAEWYYERIR